MKQEREKHLVSPNLYPYTSGMDISFFGTLVPDVCFHHPPTPILSTIEADGLNTIPLPPLELARNNDDDGPPM